MANIKNTELEGTDLEIVKRFYQIIDELIKDKKMSKGKATELSAIYIAKIYARSVIEQMEKVATRNSITVPPLSEEGDA